MWLVIYFLSRINVKKVCLPFITRKCRKWYLYGQIIYPKAHWIELYGRNSNCQINEDFLITLHVQWNPFNHKMGLANSHGHFKLYNATYKVQLENKLNFNFFFVFFCLSWQNWHVVKMWIQKGCHVAYHIFNRIKIIFEIYRYFHHIHLVKFRQIVSSIINDKKISPFSSQVSLPFSFFPKLLAFYKFVVD